MNLPTGNSPTPRTLTADRGDAGQRIDLVLRRHLGDVDSATRTRVQSWIENGQVRVNGAVVRRVSTRTALGDVVTVVLPDPVPRRAMAAEKAEEDVGLDVLNEDDHLLALDKPAGLVAHPTYKHMEGTLMNASSGAHGNGLCDSDRPLSAGWTSSRPES